MNKDKIIKIASVVFGVIIALLIVFFGFKILQSRISGAAGAEPVGVVCEAGVDSAKIQYTTGSAVQGVVQYGTSASSLTFFAPEDTATTTHSVDLQLLTAGTTYNFNIKVGDIEYDNGGVTWTCSTKDDIATKKDDSSAVPLPTLPLVTPTAAPTEAPSIAPTIDASSRLDEIKAKFKDGRYTKVSDCVADYAGADYSAALPCTQAYLQSRPTGVVTPSPSPTTKP